MRSIWSGLLVTSINIALAGGALAQAGDKKPQPPSGRRVDVSRPQKVELTVARLKELKTPGGFNVGVFGRNLGRPRMMLVLDDGTVLVTRPYTNDVVALRDQDGDGQADSAVTVASGIEKVHGIARGGHSVYLAGAKKLYAADVRSDGSLGPTRLLASDLPDGGQHALRTVGVGPDGMLYLSIGSDCNDCVESNPEHATVLRLKPDGTGRTIVARGLRNTIGFDWHPKTRQLWGADIGADFRGDFLPPEEINHLVDGAHYGWPYCYGDRQVDPVRDAPEGTTSEHFCAESKGPALTLPAHGSPIAFTFYRGSQFPEEFRGDAFVAMHGSWNRSPAYPAQVLRVHFEDGQPVRSEPFVSGFAADGGKSWFARPAGLAVARSGALLVSDDENGVIYDVSYGKPPQHADLGPDFQDAPGLLARVAHVTGFQTPESALHDEQQDVYFVSNINGKPGAKDGNGFISRVTPEGKIEKLDFIKAGRDGVALDAPKGLAITGDTLWVTDLDSVRGFDRKTGAPRKTIDLAPQGAVFLNDIAVGPDGALFVTDTGYQFDADGSRNHPGPDRVFRIDREGRAKVIATGPALGGPNGIAWDGRRLIVVEAVGKSILTLGAGGGKPSAIATGVGMFDGLVVMPGGALLISSQYDNTIYKADRGMLTPLLPSPPTPADIGFDRKRNRLLIPSLQGNWVDVWHLPGGPGAPSFTQVEDR